MKDATVTVCIVSYKSADLAIDCLRSLEQERQAFPELELRAIVVDNASGDGPKLIRATESNTWNWVTILEAPKNGGFAYGNNWALRHAYKGSVPSYFYLLNPDTVVLRGAIKELVRVLESHQDVGIVGSALEDVDGSPWASAFRFPSIATEVEHGTRLGRLFRSWSLTLPSIQDPHPADWVSGAAMMIRREVIERIGGLDENLFLYFEEPEFCFRAKTAGFSTWSVPASRVIHIVGQSTNAMGHSKQKRLPSYWFESRRRYFAVVHGIRYAIVADMVALLANCFGKLKDFALRRKNTCIPYYMSDLAHHSPIWRRHRTVDPPRLFLPTRPEL